MKFVYLFNNHSNKLPVLLLTILTASCTTTKSYDITGKDELKHYRCISTKHEVALIKYNFDCGISTHSGDGFWKVTYIPESTKQEYLENKKNNESISDSNKPFCAVKRNYHDIVVIPKGTEIKLTSLQSYTVLTMLPDIKFSGIITDLNITVHETDAQSIMKYMYSGPTVINDIDKLDYLKMDNLDYQKISRTYIKEVTALEYLDYYYDKCTDL